MPSRMTLSYPMEIFANELFAVTGEHIDASCTSKFDLDDIKRKLKEHRYNPYCEHQMYSFLTTETYPRKVFMR